MTASDKTTPERAFYDAYAAAHPYGRGFEPFDDLADENRAAIGAGVNAALDAAVDDGQGGCVAHIRGAKYYRQDVSVVAALKEECEQLTRRLAAVRAALLQGGQDPETVRRQAITLIGDDSQTCPGGC